MPILYQINVSDGGVPKRPVAGAHINRDGVEGDRQADTVHHGGPDRAVCLFSLEVIKNFQAEGHPIQPGSAGENLTISGLDWDEVVPGTRLAVGEDVQLEITSYTSPCDKNASWFKDGEFTRMLQSRHPGESRLYARVLSEGPVRAGDAVEVMHGSV
ncbi:MAG: MOSC domain-containing protein [Acidimicrobiia bacterium]|nr:MOSC domain-containing protein [Acidimicrobiia bacterium]